MRKADAFGPSCIQTIVAGEEAVDLRVHDARRGQRGLPLRQRLDAGDIASEKRPVFVYIYGGANIEGSGMVPVYDGEGLASKGLVVVNFNYRVGVLGFFTHPDLSKEAAYHASGNYGLLDQIAAVKWVHDNIAGFGGDPARITVAGQSAGGQAVHNLTASPLAKGIVPARDHRERRRARAARRRWRTPKPTACSSRRRKERRRSRELRAKTWQEIVAPVPAPPRLAAAAAGLPLRHRRRRLRPAGTRQRDLRAGQTERRADAHRQQCGRRRRAPQPTTTAQDFERQARQRYGESADEFLKLYPAATDEPRSWRRIESARDHGADDALCLGDEPGEDREDEGLHLLLESPAPRPDVAQYGAFHTSEVPYVLNTLEQSDRPFTDVDRKIADTAFVVLGRTSRRPATRTARACPPGRP